MTMSGPTCVKGGGNSHAPPGHCESVLQEASALLPPTHSVPATGSPGKSRPKLDAVTFTHPGTVGAHLVDPVHDRGNTAGGIGVHLVAPEHRMSRPRTDVVAVVRRYGRVGRRDVGHHQAVQFAGRIPPPQPLENVVRVEHDLVEAALATRTVVSSRVMRPVRLRVVSRRQRVTSSGIPSSAMGALDPLEYTSAGSARRSTAGNCWLGNPP